MPDIIGNEGKKFNTKKLLLGGGFLALVIVVMFVVMGGNKEKVVVTDANTVKALENQNANYDGETKDVDSAVKEEKETKIVKNREQAAEKKTTQIESVPIDKEYIKEDKNTDIKAILNEKTVVCVTTEYDESGFHCKTGYDRQGFDRNGFDKNGFNKQGCNAQGLDINGKPCGNFLNPVKNECLEKLCNGDESLYDAAGYDKYGYDKQGFDKQGFNKQGCDRQGYDKDGYSCTTKLNRNGFDRNGCDANGFDKDGYSCATKLNKDGFDREGYDKDGFNKDGCNKDGFTKDGKTCKGKGTKVALTADEKIWYNNLLASKNAYLKEIANGQTQYAMEINVKKDVEFQSYVAPEVVADKGGSGSGDSSTKPEEKPLNDANIEIPTGTMLYGQIQANLNSDYPGMVRVKVLGGPLDQSLMMGSYAVPFIEDAYRPRDKIKMTLNKMVYSRNTITINAVALDTQSMTDYLSGDVDYHYFTRWGGLIAANVLKGIGRAVATQGTTASNDGSGLVYAQPITATGDQLKVAAGEVGNELSTIARQQFDRPPTVTKDQGEMVAIFFMDELNDDRVPMIFNSREMIDIAEKSKLNPNATIK